MKIENAIASIAVKDLRSAAAWYERLFGRAPNSTPMPEVAEWKFPRGGWLQVYQLPERAGAGSCTLAVDDIERRGTFDSGSHVQQFAEFPRPHRWIFTVPPLEDRMQRRAGA